MMWSYLLATATTAGLFLVPRTRYGWLVALASQFLWTAYALATHQYGFLFAAATHAWVYLRNFHETKEIHA